MRHRFACSTLLFLLLAACVSTPPPQRASALGAKEFRASEQFVIAAQPKAGRLVELAAAGFARVISINPAAKAPKYDEAAAVKAAGLAYENVPVSKDTISDRAVRERAYAALDRAEASGQKTYVHCSSANRASALWALYQAERKQLPAAEALAAGKAVGLTKLEPAVRKLLGLPEK